jgi:hypothetical protein
VIPPGFLSSNQNVTMAVSPKTSIIAPIPSWTSASNEVPITFASPISASSNARRPAALATSQLIFHVSIPTNLTPSNSALVGQQILPNGAGVYVSPDATVLATSAGKSLFGSISRSMLAGAKGYKAVVQVQGPVGGGCCHRHSVPGTSPYRPVGNQVKVS